MSSWRDQILREFSLGVSRLTLVADPDSLLVEESVLAGIYERGFELIPFEDPIVFRYAYESKYRSFWDQGKETNLVVVLRVSADDLGRLPYDLLQAGRQLSFSLGEFFPNLSYPVLAALDRGSLDTLYEAQRLHPPRMLGDNGTKDFVLRHVFGIAPELIKKPSDLLRLLLRRHHREERVPALLDERCIQLLRQQGNFHEWPLDAIVPDRESFFDFLQERWPVFLNRSATQGGNKPVIDQESNGFEFEGPTDLPFDHDDIRIYIDNLFLEGLLKPIPHEQAESLANTWLGVGIQVDDRVNQRRRVEGLLDTLRNDAPRGDSRHEDWFHFARTWAELTALVRESEEVLSKPARESMESLQAEVDTVLVTWLLKRYAGLVNLPPLSPVMLHHIPRLLARKIDEDDKSKVAFLLVDGLSLDQWIVIRKELASKRTNYRFRESAVFAWIPTITAVSRQAAFAGKPPLFFPESIGRTDKESALWTQFWADQGLAKHQVSYVKGLGDGTLEQVEANVTKTNSRVVGLVVDKVDRIMHGMELGAAGMHNQVRQWARQRFMEKLLDLLLENGFQVYLTSDHGNIEVTGCGRPAEGVLADVRGQRVRIYPDSRLRDKVNERFPEALAWPTIGLPDDYLPLLAHGRSAFVRENERLVSHGGASLEELIVPFVQIERRGA